MNCMLSFHSAPLLPAQTSVGECVCECGESLVLRSLWYTRLKIDCLSLWSAGSMLGRVPVYTFVFFVGISLTLARPGKYFSQDSIVLNRNKTVQHCNCIVFPFLHSRAVGLHHQNAVRHSFVFFLWLHSDVRSIDSRCNWTITEPQRGFYADVVFL